MTDRNLDSTTAKSILHLVRRLNEERLTIVVVTHNRELANATDRQITLGDGWIVADSPAVR